VNILASFRLWLCAVVLVAVAAVVVTPSGSTWQSRVAHLESLVRCPSCTDLSVAQSTQSSSLAVRAQITSMVKAGQSDTVILTTIERSYGANILLSPSTGGLGVLLWAGPLAVVVGATAIGLRLRKRR
jgi:cytochrome c-type biogenesis protein CcmH